MSGAQSATAASANRSAPSANAVLRSPLERRDATDAKMTAPITRAVLTSGQAASAHGSGCGPPVSVPGRGPDHGHGHFLGQGVPHQSSMISVTKADDEAPCASDATASRTTSCAISAAPTNRASRGGNGCGLRATLSRADTTRTRGPCGMIASQISGWIVPMIESRFGKAQAPLIIAFVRSRRCRRGRCRRSPCRRRRRPLHSVVRCDCCESWPVHRTYGSYGPISSISIICRSRLRIPILRIQANFLDHHSLKGRAESDRLFDIDHLSGAILLLLLQEFPVVLPSAFRYPHPTRQVRAALPESLQSVSASMSQAVWQPHPQRAWRTIIAPLR